MGTLIPNFLLSCQRVASGPPQNIKNRRNLPAHLEHTYARPNHLRELRHRFAAGPPCPSRQSDTRNRSLVFLPPTGCFLHHVAQEGQRIMSAMRK